MLVHRCLFAFSLLMEFSLLITLLLVLKVVDCRVCGDPNSVLRFAFVEFTDEGRATNPSLILYSD